MHKYPVHFELCCSFAKRRPHRSECVLLSAVLVRLNVYGSSIFMSTLSRVSDDFPRFPGRLCKKEQPACFIRSIYGVLYMYEQKAVTGPPRPRGCRFQTRVASSQSGLFLPSDLSFLTHVSSDYCLCGDMDGCGGIYPSLTYCCTIPATRDDPFACCLVLFRLPSLCSQSRRTS